MRSAILLLALCYVVCGNAAAQKAEKPHVQFVGRVLDLNDETPKPTAIDRNNALHRVVHADSSVAFSIDIIPPFLQNVEASRLGYISTKAEINIAASDTVVIR